jgi:hypothetical protein
MGAPNSDPEFPGLTENVGVRATSLPTVPFTNRVSLLLANWPAVRSHVCFLPFGGHAQCYVQQRHHPNGYVYAEDPQLWRGGLRSQVWAIFEW